MFDTERFVLEVQNRPCIWDSREKYDRTAKKQAWEEIGSLLYKSFDGETETKQRELVDELQKKWKHLRDYYVKEKKLEERTGTAPKKRKTSYVDMLQFLDVLKESRSSTGNISSPVTDNDHTENSYGETSTYTNSQQTLIENSRKTDEVPVTSQIKNKTKMTAVQPNLITTEQATNENEDADTKFLLSLLPQMKSLNERQNFEFRLEVMNTLYKIKYLNPYNMPHSVHPYNDPGYTHEPSPAGYTVDVAPPAYPSTSSNSPIPSPELNENRGQSSTEVKQYRLRKSAKYIKIETDYLEHK